MNPDKVMEDPVDIGVIAPSYPIAADTLKFKGRLYLIRDIYSRKIVGWEGFTELVPLWIAGHLLSWSRYPSAGAGLFTRRT
jgi:hypothetical protein